MDKRTKGFKLYENGPEVLVPYPVIQKWITKYHRGIALKIAGVAKLVFGSP